MAVSLLDAPETPVSTFPGGLPTGADRAIRQRREEFADLSSAAAADKELLLEQVIAATHVDMSVRLIHPGEARSFAASVRRRWFDDLALVDVSCDPCSGRRGTKRARQDDRPYLGVMVLREGRESVVLGETSADLVPGDGIVWRSDQPARFVVHESQRKQTLIVPLSALSECIGGHTLFRSVFLDGRAPSMKLFTRYLDLLSETGGDLGPPELSAARSAALELFAAAARGSVGDGGPMSSAATTLAVVKRWIERNLAVVDVTPNAIAAAHGVSVRTIYRLFADADETVSGFVRSRRLARARLDLVSSSDSVAAVAARWGFVDASHLARAFRSRYGSAPGEYRAQHAVRNAAR